MESPGLHSVVSLCLNLLDPKKHTLQSLNYRWHERGMECYYQKSSSSVFYLKNAPLVPVAKDAIKDVVVGVNMYFAQITVLATKKEIVRTNNEVTTEVTIIVLYIYLHIILIHLLIFQVSNLLLFFYTILRGSQEIFDFNLKTVIF